MICAQLNTMSLVFDDWRISPFTVHSIRLPKHFLTGTAIPVDGSYSIQG